MQKVNHRADICQTSVKIIQKCHSGDKVMGSMLPDFIGFMSCFGNGHQTRRVKTNNERELKGTHSLCSAGPEQRCQQNFWALSIEPHRPGRHSALHSTGCANTVIAMDQNIWNRVLPALWLLLVPPLPTWKEYLFQGVLGFNKTCRKLAVTVGSS